MMGPTCVRKKYVPKVRRYHSTEQIGANMFRHELLKNEGRLSQNQLPGILNRIQRIPQKCYHPGLAAPRVLHAPEARMTVVNTSFLKQKVDLVGVSGILFPWDVGGFRDLPGNCLLHVERELAYSYQSQGGAAQAS